MTKHTQTQCHLFVLLYWKEDEMLIFLMRNTFIQFVPVKLNWTGIALSSLSHHPPSQTGTVHPLHCVDSNQLFKTDFDCIKRKYGLWLTQSTQSITNYLLSIFVWHNLTCYPTQYTKPKSKSSERDIYHGDFWTKFTNL